MNYRTNDMIVTAQGTTLTASWVVERSPDGETWTPLEPRLSFSSEASTPITELREQVDQASQDVALRDRVVQELAVAAAAFYKEREIILP